MFEYNKMTQRNAGYVSQEVQKKLSTMRVLIAGCGIGSAVAIALARFGVQHFVLVDGDTIEEHNLNRQFYTQADIGADKTEALKKHILAINPQADIVVSNVFINAENIATIDQGQNVDLVIDGIDFISIEAIQAMHLYYLPKGVPILSIMNIGFGAGALYFDPQSDITFQDILGFEAGHALSNQDYINGYAGLVQKMGAFLDGEVIEVFTQTFKLMAEGKPCPASQVVSGVFCCGVLAPYLVREFIAGHKIPSAPHFMYLDIKNGLKTEKLI